MIAIMSYISRSPLMALIGIAFLAPAFTERCTGETVRATLPAMAKRPWPSNAGVVPRITWEAPDEPEPANITIRLDPGTRQARCACPVVSAAPGRPQRLDERRSLMGTPTDRRPSRWPG